MQEAIVYGKTLPEAYHMALMALYERGEETPCPDYATSQRELSMTMVVEEPLAEPMKSRLFIGGPRELEQYRQEMLDGILDFEVERGNWEYTYHSRMAEQFDFIQSTSEYYEILPKGAGKGALMLRMADMFGISHEKTVAVGDNINDVSMIEMAGLGVAVANATPEAKAVADLVLDTTNEQHAVADLIRRLELERLI